MIRVGRKHEQNAVYVGRPSLLGNPFKMRNEGDRDLVCDRYDTWLSERLRQGDPLITVEIDRLVALARQGDLVLGCYCAPARCHADSIKRVIEARLRSSK